MRLLPALAALAATAATAPAPISPADIHTVHVVQSCHLDVGFADSAANIVNRYFDHYWPSAIDTAKELKQKYGDKPGGPRLVFSTFPYLLSLFLDCPPGLGIHCPSPEAKAKVVQGFKDGDLVLFGFPHNSETELWDAALFDAAIDLGKKLAKELGVKAPITFSQRDVPGVTAAAIPALRRREIQAISVGVNTASLAAAVPKAAVWRVPDCYGVEDCEILHLFHPLGYGGIGLDDAVLLPNGHALVYDWNGDNAGPWAAKDVEDHWAQIKGEFPNAVAVAGGFDDFVAGPLMDARASLPVFTGEIGDTWIYGVPADPWRTAAHRALSREWTAYTDAQGQDDAVANFTRLLMKNPEHTDGKDHKTFLHDTTNWTNAQFHRQRGVAPNFIDQEASWEEQSLWGVQAPVDALPKSHPFRAKVERALAQLEVSSHLPSSAMAAASRRGAVELDEQAAEWASEKDGAVVVQRPGGPQVVFDREMGAAVAVNGASAPIGELRYRVYNTTDYDEYFEMYAERVDGKIPSYFPLDFGKPGLPSLASEFYEFVSVGAAAVRACGESLCSEHEYAPREKSAVTDRGAPERVTVQQKFTASGLETTLLVRNKTATRIPEALFYQFARKADASKLSLGKLGDQVRIDPLEHVVANGSARLHGVSSVRAEVAGSLVTVRPLDSPVVCVGEPRAFPVPAPTKDEVQTHGFAFVLAANTWGTNYAAWTTRDSYVFRFHVDVEQPHLGDTLVV